MAHIPKILLLIDSSRNCERDFLRGIARYARLHGPWAFYRKPKFYLKSNRKSVSSYQIKNYDPDGIIVSDTENINEIKKLGKPTLIHAFKCNKHDIPTIEGDTKNSGQMGARHLMELGFSRFAFCGIDDYYWSSGRYDSFLTAVHEAGFNCEYHKLNSQHIKTNPQKELNRLYDWLVSLEKPVGLMTCADDCSQYIVEACKIAGIKIPEEIGIIGVDNDDMVCDLSNPQLSSISLDFAGAGYKAAELLDQIIRGKSARKKTITVLPTHVEARASTDILAVDDNDVAAAVRFIQTNSSKLIQISDVMNEVACCQRVLHQKFKQNLGRSIHQEIKRVRIEKIAEMLRETDLSISQIAMKLGYFNVNHISRYFQQAMGTTPLSYKKRFRSK